jgi:large subunit ribosomal protein L32
MLSSFNCESDLSRMYLILKSLFKPGTQAVQGRSRCVAMATRSSAFLPFLQHLLPSPSSPPTLLHARSRASHLFAHILTPTLPSITVPALTLRLPPLLTRLWDGLLLAVPKKKTSHSKSRSRQYAGKALKDVNAVNTCAACGKPKRAHLLCPYCVEGESVQRFVGHGLPGLG